MEYKLYTLVDITNTGQYRHEPEKEHLRWKEQNFQTVLMTLGIRANISFREPPAPMQVQGQLVGIPTSNVVRVWHFAFNTDQPFLYEKDNDPVGFLKDDFNGVPYISGLDECTEQSHDVFVTDGPAQNIVFFQR
jgi:hypothetical protein